MNLTTPDSVICWSDLELELESELLHFNQRPVYSQFLSATDQDDVEIVQDSVNLCNSGQDFDLSLSQWGDSQSQASITFSAAEDFSASFDNDIDALNSSTMNSFCNNDDIIIKNRRRYPMGDSNSKNAIAARDNRQKKKKYVSDLEENVKTLSQSNVALSKEVKESRTQINALKREVIYLRNVIANQSTLSALLNSVAKTPGISMSTSFNNTSIGCSINNNIESKQSPSSSSSSQNITLFSTTSTSRSSSSRVLRSQSGKNNVTRSSSNRKALKVQNITVEEDIGNCVNSMDKQTPFVDYVSYSDTDSNSEDVEFDFGDSSSTLSSLPASSQAAGVCLHVSGTQVSLEFCALCSSNSFQGVTLDHTYSHK